MVYELYNQLGADLNIGECENKDCSMKASLNKIIFLQFNGVQLNSAQRELFINSIAEIYCNDQNSYQCILQSNNIDFLYSILAFSTINDETKLRILSSQCNLEELDDVDNFSDIENPQNYSQVDEIDNGITIEEIYGSITTSCSGNFIGSNVDRMNVEDISHGTNGDGTGIELANRNPQESNAELFNRMDNLFWWTTSLDAELRDVGDGFIALFDNNTINTHIEDNIIINQKASESNKMKNFIKRFGADLNIWLTATSGDINGVTVSLPIDIRPAFNGNFHRFQGLQMLINDTEFTQIYILTRILMNMTRIPKNGRHGSALM